MNSDNNVTDKPAGTAPEGSNPGKPCCCGELKQALADSLSRAATALDKTATEEGVNPSLAEVEQHASQWLNQSADYIRQFDFEQEQANVRNHITRNPGRSLAIAGTVGLVLGILLRKS